MLVDAFPACGLGVPVATDGKLHQTKVHAASHSPAALVTLQHVHSPASSHRHGSASSQAHSSSSHGANGKEGKDTKPDTCAWGDRPVLLLLGIQLGLGGVNSVGCETIKMLYTFPQSVGIAGGRPSSSYYFVGVQSDGLFYLDPHHSRPAVPLRPLRPSYLDARAYNLAVARLDAHRRARARPASFPQPRGARARRVHKPRMRVRAWGIDEPR
ncbi:hypothetical protein C8R44DRAFT_332382 [Mycena epipterygia]|nr:hypothetical protein C8R44DRAFT_332382 [Mycena epipterygia]